MLRVSSVTGVIEKFEWEWLTVSRVSRVSGVSEKFEWGWLTVSRVSGVLSPRQAGGKYPTMWTDLACKRGTLPSILDTGTNFSRKAAPHLASFIDVL
jgi:hypothetical protein